MLITIGKRIVYAIIICVALLFIALGSMWCLSSHYKIYGVPVLNYHQVNDKYHSALTLDVAQFKKQMEYLHNEGYHTISLDDLYAYVTEGKELPDKPIVLTFDDGYIDNYEAVLPILESYDMQATIFMISDAVNTKRFMSINELKTMDAHKFIVEGHTNHHSILTRIDPSKLDNEIKGGKDTLQAFMGKPIRWLSQSHRGRLSQVKIYMRCQDWPYSKVIHRIYHSGCVCTARHLLLIHGNYEIHYGIMDLQNWLV